MLDFEICTGKSNDHHEFGLGGHVVLSLIDLAAIPPNAGYKIFFDNYFTSVELLTHLADKGYCASGTLRDNRMGTCPLKGSAKTNEWKKKERGHYKYSSSEKVAVVQWKDNKIVNVGTNFDAFAAKSVTRYSREQKSKINISQPEVISNYNKGMGGVDKLDQMVATCRSRMRQRKWWWPIFSYLFDVAVVNS